MSQAASPQSSDALAAVLQRNRQKQYPAYHDIEGTWRFTGFSLLIERCQGDPYAAPTCVRVQVTADSRSSSHDPRSGPALSPASPLVLW